MDTGSRRSVALLREEPALPNKPSRGAQVLLGYTPWRCVHHRAGQDWAWWIGRGWGLGSTGAQLDWARLGLGSVWARHWDSAFGLGIGARVHWAQVDCMGVGARELERGLDWGVVELGAAGFCTTVAS